MLNKASFLDVMTLREVFEPPASFWREICGADDVDGVIYQERSTAVLFSFIGWLCGAGFLSVALAKQGHKITATDVPASMVANT